MTCCYQNQERLDYGANVIEIACLFTWMFPSCTDFTSLHGSHVIRALTTECWLHWSISKTSLHNECLCWLCRKFVRSLRKHFLEKAFSDVSGQSPQANFSDSVGYATWEYSGSDSSKRARLSWDYSLGIEECTWLADKFSKSTPRIALELSQALLLTLISSFLGHKFNLDTTKNGHR